MKQLYIVGIGPCGQQDMTTRAKQAISQAELLCGYPVYVDLVRELAPDTPVLTTPMRQETERCRAALRAAAEGTTTALVCSGDAGVYGMAGLVLQLAEEYPPVEIQVVAGVTAALSGAAVLGAPLTHDFAVISLSDLLTPWEKIERRLAAAAQADFVISIYNPASRRRADHLHKACEILLRYRAPSTPCGFVRNISREGQQSCILTLSELADAPLDMFCTAFVGNSETKVLAGRLVTPRGYKL